MNIGIIGSKHYENIRKIKDLLTTLKAKFGNDLIIITGGNTTGAEKYVKKYALEFNIQYKEFNSANTQFNLYSVMSEDYYGKPWHGSQHAHRYMLLGRNVDSLIILTTRNETIDTFKMAIDTVNKRMKKVVVMN
jgi:hypothetical protein